MFKGIINCFFCCFIFLSSTAYSEEVVMPLEKIEHFYLNTVGDIENNKQVPFPILFVYNHQSKRVLSKNDTKKLLGDNFPLDFIRHENSSAEINEKNFSVKIFKNDNSLQYSVFYIIMMQWALSEPSMKNTDKKIKQYFSKNKKYRYVPIFIGG